MKKRAEKKNRWAENWSQLSIRCKKNTVPKSHFEKKKLKES